MKTKFFILVLVSVYSLSIHAQNVGIGQTNPKSKLDVNGGIIVGSGTGYSGTAVSPPANGAIIQGQVGIGNTSPNAKAILDLSNSSNLGLLLPSISSTTESTITSPPNGLVFYNSYTNCLDVAANGVFQAMYCPCPALSNPAVTGSISVCPSSTNNAYTVAPQAGAYSYTWSSTGAVIASSNANNVSVTAPASGSYTVVCTIANACGASVTGSLSAADIAAPTAPTWSVNPASVCASANTSFTFNSTSGVNYACSLSGTGNTINGASYPSASPLTLTATGSMTTITINCAVTGTLTVYAVNSCGTQSSSITSSIGITTSLGATTLAAATNVGNTSGTATTATSFSANWGAVTNATGYYLDVSTSSGFSTVTMVSGYNALNVGNVTTYSVTGLTCGTTYYYRVRAYACTSIVSANPTTPAYISVVPYIHGTITWNSSYGSWTVPCGVTSVTVDMAGAGGGNCYTTVSSGTPGAGARIQATLAVSGTVYYGVGAVGGTPASSITGGAAGTGGNNGDSKGGAGFGSAATNYSLTTGYGSGGGGGGASDIRIGGSAITNRVLSAGGGGGASNGGTGGNGGQAGTAGGGTKAAMDGKAGTSNAAVAQVAAYTSGGGCTGATVGAASTAALGGAGGLGIYYTGGVCQNYGGGGGGGGMGGGTGGSGGGGGGAYTYTAGTGVSAAIVTGAYQTGAGYITLTW